MSDPTEVRINLNARVTVRLTPRGREMVAAYYRDLLPDLLPDLPHLWPEVPAAGEPYSDQLWSIANILGPGMRPGAHPMIEGLTFTAPVGECVEVVRGEPAPDAPGLDLPPILTRMDPADIPALVAEVTRLRTALEQSVARGATAVNEALREGEEARAERDDVMREMSTLRCGITEPLGLGWYRVPQPGGQFVLVCPDDAEIIAAVSELVTTRSRLATLESAPTFADGVRAMKVTALAAVSACCESAYADIERIDPSTVKP